LLLFCSRKVLPGLSGHESRRREQVLSLWDPCGLRTGDLFEQTSC
jgi:hypothetical protein